MQRSGVNVPPNERKRSKTEVLAEDGTLNPTPSNVLDAKFQEGGFFDPHDAVQVKYEMLRRVSVEKDAMTVGAGGALARLLHDAGQGCRPRPGRRFQGL